MKLFIYCVFFVLFSYNANAEVLKWVAAADPQHFRTRDSGDDQSVNSHLVYLAVESINQLSGYKFCMINGDLSEYAHGYQLRHFLEQTYAKIKSMPILFGCGNHDIENNLGDCQDGLTISISKDGCAADAWLMMYQYLGVFTKYGLDNYWYRRDGRGCVSFLQILIFIRLHIFFVFIGW